MSEPNDSTPAERLPVRMCVDCRVITTTPIMIRAIEQASGPGWSLYACSECAHRHLTHAEVMQLLIEHTAVCEQCALPSPAEPCPQGRAIVHVHTRTLRKGQITKSAP